MAQLLATSTELLRKITQLEATQATYPLPPVAAIEYADIIPTYATDNDIPLDAVKVIHEFNGDKKVYHSWLMKQIENHQTTPKYADK